MNKEKKKNPCDKCPWRAKETCKSCELKEKARAAREVRRIKDGEVESN